MKIEFKIEGKPWTENRLAEIRELCKNSPCGEKCNLITCEYVSDNLSLWMREERWLTST